MDICMDGYMFGWMDAWGLQSDARTSTKLVILPLLLTLTTDKLVKYKCIHYATISV